jgi:hypothetical protein
MLKLLSDIEIDIACMIDCFEEVTEADLYALQVKITRLHNEYILSSTQPE